MGEFFKMFVGFPLYIFTWVCAGRFVWKVFPQAMEWVAVHWRWLWS
jgi:hypothetical protein